MSGTLFGPIDWLWRTFFGRDAREPSAATSLAHPSRTRGDSPAARPPSAPGGHCVGRVGSAAHDPLSDVLRQWDFASDASLSRSPASSSTQQQPPPLLSAEDVRRRVLSAELSLWELPLEVVGLREGRGDWNEDEESERGAAVGSVTESKRFCFTPIAESGATTVCGRSLAQTISLQGTPQQQQQQQRLLLLSHHYSYERSGSGGPPPSHAITREEEAWRLEMSIREVTAILLHNRTTEPGTSGAGAEYIERGDRDRDRDEDRDEEEATSTSYSGAHLLHESDTAADLHVRAIYDALVSRFCGAVVSHSTSHCYARLNGAATRALDRWLLSRVHALVAEAVALRGAFPPRGIARHVRGGLPAALCALRPDVEDERIAAEAFRGGGVGFSPAAPLPLPLHGAMALTHEQIATLRRGVWLSDQVVNAYLALLCSAVGEVAAVSLGTHFFARVEQEMGPSYSAKLQPLAPGSGALRWLRRRQHILRRGCGTRVVLVPLNLSQNHWALAVLDWERRAWIYYDSNITGSTAVARGRGILRLLAHVFDEARRLLDAQANNTHNGGTENQNKSETRATDCRLIVALPSGEEENEDVNVNGMQEWGEGCGLGGVAVAPQQRNSYDCGVFVCHAAWCAVHGVALDFTQADVTALRQVMLHELLCQRILRRFPFSAFTTETVSLV